MNFVVDASVAIKWVIDETGTDAALSLRRERLFAPDLLIAECANILWKKVRRKEISQREATTAARLLVRADIQLEPMRPLLESAVRFAITLDHPAYDCAYLALADRLGCELVTADLALCRRLQLAGSPVPARPLGQTTH